MKGACHSSYHADCGVVQSHSRDCSQAWVYPELTWSRGAWHLTIFSELEHCIR